MLDSEVHAYMYIYVYKEIIINKRSQFSMEKLTKLY